MIVGYQRDPNRSAGPARRCERGASLVEYALLVALIAIVALAAVTFLGRQSSGGFDKSGKAIDGGSGAGGFAARDQWFTQCIHAGGVPEGASGPGGTIEYQCIAGGNDGQTFTYDPSLP